MIADILNKLTNLVHARATQSVTPKAYGHPLLAKVIKSNAPRANRPGREYPGYCAGSQETFRRFIKHGGTV